MQPFTGFSGDTRYNDPSPGRGLNYYRGIGIQPRGFGSGKSNSPMNEVISTGYRSASDHALLGMRHLLPGLAVGKGGLHSLI